MAVTEAPAARREELIRDYLPLARRLAARYRYTSEPFEDLVQIASLGLVKAADRYDPDRGTPFASFATPTMLGELRRHIRDHGWAARVPRTMQENAMRVTTLRDDLSAKLGRSPTPSELAEAAGLDVETVLDAFDATAAYEADSLDRRFDRDGEGDGAAPAIGGHDAGYERVEYGAALGPAMAELSERERAVVALRFVEDLTQSEIARRVGVSQMQVSRLLRRALARLGNAVAGGTAR